MSDNGSGTYVVNSAGQPVVSATPITAAAFNAYTADAATAMSNRICKDGQTTVTANIPMATYKFTGLGAGSARTDSCNIGNVQDGTGVYAGTVGGTADAITLTPSPAITAHATGQVFEFIAPGSTYNTGAVTVAISGLAAKDVKDAGAVALSPSRILGGQLIKIRYDGTQYRLLSNPLTNSTFTPGLTCATPGDLSVTLSQAYGEWMRVGNIYTVHFHLVSSAFTHTTASGAVSISGFPSAAAASSIWWSCALSEWSGVTKANYTQIGGIITGGATALSLRASGSAQASGAVNIADLPTGGSVVLRGSITYRTSQ